MIAGRLNEVIQIFELQEEVNEYGEREQKYVFKCITRAKVEWNNGNRTVENNEIVFNYDKIFNVRSYVPVTETSQIKWQGKFYRIHTVEHRREYNDILINAELIND